MLILALRLQEWLFWVRPAERPHKERRDGLDAATGAA